MNKGKDIQLFIPELMTTHLEDCLKNNPPNFSYQKDYFFYVIHYLVLRQLRRKENGVNNNFIHIDLNYLISVTTSNINRYVVYLKKYYILKSDKSYRAGVKSLRYKLNEDLIDKLITVEIHPYSKMGKKILKRLRLDKNNYSKLPQHLKLMQKKIMEIGFDYVGAKKYVIDNIPEGHKRLSYLSVIANIQDPRFRYFKRNSTNYRLDTNFTNLPKVLKQFIINSKNYVSVDLKNCQPFLLGVLINEILTTKKDKKLNNKSRSKEELTTLSTICGYFLPSTLSQTFGVTNLKRISTCNILAEKRKNSDFYYFLNSTKEGNLYEYIIDNYPEEITRNEVKDMLFGVFYSSNGYYKNGELNIPYEEEKKIFASLFPTVAQDIINLKTFKKWDGYKKLPIYLQRLESYLFIDCIAKELVENNIIPLTIHDSVIVRSEDKEKTLRIMEKVFMDEVGAVPTFSIELLSTSKSDK